MENQEAGAEDQKNQQGVHREESEEVLKNEHKLADEGEIHLLQDSGEVAKDQQEADNHGEIDLENSDLEVMKNEEESAHGELSYQIITKEELEYKIICYSLDMTQISPIKGIPNTLKWFDPTSSLLGEAEEVLEHLVNHVPEWISRKSFLGGDVFSINRTMDVESVLTKIEQT
ncbi:unnamed protein product [Citrullus colocynthis]|uniref:Uncharacterized protein n=1 Tax=Citrullus colocynthis TaxID=252529 RepID=A0ABP0XKP2_9ROSI